MNQDPNVQVRSFEQVRPEQQSFRDVLVKVFQWMGLGLLLTSAVAYFASHSTGLWRVMMRMPWLTFVIVIAQLFLAVFFNTRLRDMQVGAAKGTFIAYALLTGLTFGMVLTMYTSATIFLAFLLTAVTFAGMAFFGARTKRDLSSIGYMGYSLLFGVIIVSLVNLLLYFVWPGFASGLDYILNYVVVALFIGITAWDMQKIKRMSYAAGTMDYGTEVTVSTDALGIYGAFMLYLDFINLYIRLLSILGRNSNQD